MGFGYGDPAELERLAAKLTRLAADVRRCAADEVTRAQGAHWVSATAEVYRERVRQDRVHADHSADEIDRAAAALRAHAQRVRETLAEISRVEHEVTDWFGRQAQRLAHGVEEVVEVGGDLVSRIVHHDPPWSGWLWTPHNLPPSGDRQWLDVGRFMAGRSVV